MPLSALKNGAFQNIPELFLSALCRNHSVLCALEAVHTYEIQTQFLHCLYLAALQGIQLYTQKKSKVI